MIAVSNLGVFFGRQVLFEDVSFQLNPGNKYGVVGANGSGKSTLLKVLAGEIAPETGEVRKPRSLTLGLLQQDHFKYEDQTILNVVLMGRPTLWQAIAAKKEIENAPHIDDRKGKELAELEIVIADCNGYQAEAEAAEILAGLGILPSQNPQKLRTLSGGYKLRVLLAQCLFGESGCLLLDEPTNHLDIISIQWLEEYLANFAGMTFVISHDRHFINRISDHIIDIDYETITIYTGDYDAFLAAKRLEREQKEAEIKKQEKKREELKQFIDRFKAKATKARQASSKGKQLERLDDIIIKRSSRIAPSFDFSLVRPSGKLALEFENLEKSFGEKRVLHNISHAVQRGEKIAVIGPNGIGKSTLIKIVADIYPPTGGRATKGYEINWSYFPQDHREIVGEGTTAYEWLYSFAPWEEIGTIRGLLGRVLLSGDNVHKPTKALSGGESSRLIFAKIMLQKPNLLLLDEPTNHMDLESIDALGKALKQYRGTIVCVSHNRQFIDSFASGILELNADGFDYFPGNYAEYLEKKGSDYLNRYGLDGSSRQAQRKKRGEKKSSHNERKKRKKEASKLKKILQRKEIEIEHLEKTIADMDLSLSQKEIYRPENKKKMLLARKEKERCTKRLASVLKEWETYQINIDKLSSRLE